MSVYVVFDLVFLFVIVYFFFFQAEYGIRDSTVTGVQTCALPIYSLGAKVLKSLGIDPEAVREQVDKTVAWGQEAPSGTIDLAPTAKKALELARSEATRLEIGTASCRERGERKRGGQRTPDQAR